MFVKEFFFSSLLLTFTGILMTIGIVLLVDAIRRFAIDAYNSLRPKVNTTAGVASSLTSVEKTKDEPAPLEEAA